MIDPRNTLAPYIDGPGLVISVGAATVLVSGTSYNVPLTVIGLTANTTNYVYLNTSGSVQVNTSGFAANVYPISTVTTNNTGVSLLVDSRPDIALASGSGSSIPGLRVVTNSYQPVQADGTIICNGTLTITLLTSFSNGTTFRLKNVGTGTVTVTSAANIDASTTFSLNSYQYQSIDVQWDSSTGQWWIL